MERNTAIRQCRCRDCGKIVMGRRTWLGHKLSTAYKLARHKCNGAMRSGLSGVPATDLANEPDRR